jgi:RNA polymerase sigma-70 factor (ECF subfamily)
MSEPSPPSFPALYRDHGAHIRRAVRAAGVQKRHCEDVMQEALLRIHGALPRFEPGRRLRPWLLQIAYFTAVDHLRRPEHRELPTAEVDMVDQRTEEQTPERGAATREAEQAFCQATASIPESQRIVFLMYEIDELTIPDIAEALQIPTGTATSRLSRGRACFDAAVERMRAAQERQQGGAAVLPLFLASPAALFDAGRALPEVSPEGAARSWGRLMRATSKGAAAGALSHLAALTPSQIVAALLLTGSIGLIAGALGTILLLHSGSAGSHGEAVADHPRVEAVVVAASASAAMAPIDRAVLAEGPAATVPTGARSGEAPEPALWAEQALLDKAQAALQQGDPRAALKELAKHAQQFPSGVHAEERERMKRQAAALLQQDAGAR